MSAKNMLAKGSLGLLSELDDLARRLEVLERRSAGIPDIASVGMTMIQDSKLTAAAANFDFDGITQIYKHLRLVGNLRGDTAVTTVAILLRLNNVSSANYYDQRMQASATTPASTENLGGTSATLVGAPGGTATANVMGKLIVSIPDYTEATRMPGGIYTAHRSHVLTTGGLVIITGGFLLNVAGAVTRVTVTPAAGNWDTDSRLTLYGLS